jgi:hypothetical protein
MIRPVVDVGFPTCFIFQIQGFEKECLVFGDFMDKYQAMREKVGLKKLCIPTCYLADNDGGIIIMENLKTQGFGMLNKINAQGREKNIQTKTLTTTNHRKLSKTIENHS